MVGFGQIAVVAVDAEQSVDGADFGEGRIPGEFVFLPRTPDAAEGDGWMMGYVIDRNRQTSALEILDAMMLGVVGTVEIPHLIPPGFHGNWIAAS